MENEVRALPVIVGISIDDPSRARVIAMAARALLEPGAHLRLVHVHAIRSTQVLDYTYLEPPEKLAEYMDVAAKRLDEMQAAVGAPSSTDVCIGNPSEVMLELAKKASLVVVGRTHRGLVGRVLEGSVELRLAQESPCPVLVIP